MLGDNLVSNISCGHFWWPSPQITNGHQGLQLTGLPSHRNIRPRRSGAENLLNVRLAEVDMLPTNIQPPNVWVEVVQRSRSHGRSYSALATTGCESMSPKRMLSAPGCASRLLSQIQRESSGLITEGVVLQNCGCRCRLGALLPSEEPALLLDITDTPRSYTRNLSKSYAVLRLPGLHTSF